MKRCKNVSREVVYRLYKLHLVRSASASATRCFSSSRDNSSNALADRPIAIPATKIRSRLLISPARDPEAPREDVTTVPLSLADYHLRYEQLPFGFFFRETLDPLRLERSLRRVLARFPVVAGRISPEGLDIECRPCTDFVPFSSGAKDMTLQQWLRGPSHNGNQFAGPSVRFSHVLRNNHVHTSGDGHPVLLDLFDSLFPNHTTETEATSDRKRVMRGSVGSDVDDDADSDDTPLAPLLSVRVTHFRCGGTAVGVNWNHALGDAESLLYFVRCWGREARRRPYCSVHSNNRSNAALSGMSRQFRDVLLPPHDDAKDRRSLRSSRVSCLSSSLESASWLLDVIRRSSPAVSSRLSPTHHQYLYLHFPPPLLAAMKAYGMSHATESSTDNDCKRRFVSTNDMITAFGWLLKRSLSGLSDNNISMVVNLRGRCDNVVSFDRMSFDESDCAPSYDRHGLLGNAITNVIAALPRTESGFDMLATAQAAVSIRRALQRGLEHIDDRIDRSRQGRPLPVARPNDLGSFSSTSWSRFPLGSIRFEQGRMVGFHGHPSHPLPLGCTYSSVICPCVADKDMKEDDGTPDLPSNRPSQTGAGSMYMKLFLPDHKVAEASRIHENLSHSFVAWHQGCLPGESKDLGARMKGCELKLNHFDRDLR